VNFINIGAYVHPITWCTLSPRIGITGLRLSLVTVLDWDDVAQSQPCDFDPMAEKHLRFECSVAFVSVA
jgi:hypothetical protein